MKRQGQFRVLNVLVGIVLLLSLLAFTPKKILGAPNAIVVNSLDDDAGSCTTKKCTLRQAINDSSSGGTINFDSSLVNNTIYLGSELTIDKDLIIDNQNKDEITISGNEITRIFHVTYHDSLTLENLILRDGISYGAAIWSEQGYVTIEKCQFVSNSSSSGSTGAIYNQQGTMTVIRSTFIDNEGKDGGGIKNSGFLTVRESTFENNIGRDYGGAIYNNLGAASSMELIVEDSTFKGNSTTNYDGGAIYNDSYGPVTIINSTFYNNTAANEGGGIFSESETGGGTHLTVINSTLSGNSAGSSTLGAGLASYGWLSLYNTIIANSVVGYDCYWNFGGTALSVHNLIENNAPSPQDCETPYLSSDPMLGPLADNGGNTQTMALQTGSPAIDAGNTADCPDADQRGLGRPQGAGCDIGAYEVDSYPSVFASVTVDPNPTNETYVDFMVTFNEPVTGVNTSDFFLTTSTSIHGAYVSAVTGSDDVYIVTIYTGSGTGTIRLDVVDDDSINDSGSNPLGGTGIGNGNFSAGEFYAVRYHLIYLPIMTK